MNDFANLLIPFAISLVVGFLIGAERESLRLHQNVKVLAGLRTFLFVGIWGFLSAVLQTHGFSPFFMVSFVMLVLLVIMAEFVRSTKEGLVGLTTGMALILTFVLGAMTVFFDPRMVLALAVVIAMILSFKSNFTRFLGILPREAVLATLQFAVLSAAILPFLPNTYIDPWQFFNPYIAWWIVVLISGISFVGYLLNLLLGSQKSVILTAAVGGLISSTAVTSSMAQLSKTTRISHKLLLTGCILTSTIAALRIWMTTSTLNGAMFFTLMGPVITFAVIGSIFIWFARSKDTKDTESEAVGGFTNPFSLKSALAFAAFFVFITFIAKTTTSMFGSKGLYFTSLFAGLADIDAISISVSQLFLRGTITQTEALIATTTAFLSNIWVKWSIVAFFAGDGLAKYLLRYTIAITLGGLGAVYLLSQFYFN